MNKINKSSNMNILNSKIIEDAAKKLQQIEKGQKQAEKYFKEREMNEQKLKMIETNLKKKINSEKKTGVGIEEKTFEKIDGLLHLLSTLNSDTLEKISQSKNEKLSQYVQTEKEDTEILKEKLINLEKENEKNLARKNELKRDLAVAKTEIENLKMFNDKLSKENKLIQNELEDNINAKNELSSKLIEIEKENKELRETLKKFEQNLKEFEVLKKHMEEQLQIEKDTVEEEEKTRRKVIEHYRGNLELLAYFKMMEKVTYYLKPSDINNLKLTNRVINTEIETNPHCSKDYFKKSIYDYQRKITELNKYDLKKDYHISEGELERIISE